MVRKRNNQAQELDLRLSEAVLGVQTKKYKSAQAAAIALNLRPDTVRRRVRGIPTRTEARQQQQLLSKNQEKTLLKWIKELTSSGYAPSHRILREVADEVRTNRCRIFQSRGMQSQLQTQQQTQQPQLQIPKLPLGQDWVP